MRKKNLIRIVLATALILLVPLGAKLFTDDMDWSVFDFVAAGGLLLGTGLAYELVASRAGNLAHKLAVGLAVGGALLLLWLNLAVGIIGAEDNPANLMNFAVVAIGAIGALIAFFEPRRMVRVMLAMALAQALVAVITAVGGFATGVALTKTLLLDAFFVGLWMASALLFRRASETAPVL